MARNIKIKELENIRVPTTIYIDKNDVLDLKNIQNIVFKDYNIKISTTDLIRDAIEKFLATHFNPDTDLKEACKHYLSNRGVDL